MAEDSQRVQVTECPRDAFQGLPKFIPTDDKIAYMNALTAAGVRRIDFGSFVSPKAVPQMADTAAVFENMDKPQNLQLIGIIGNERGLEGILACNGKLKSRGRISHAGYPLSVNETFQQRNLGRSIAQSWTELEPIAKRCRDHGVVLVCYLSMAFGNPYGEAHDVQTVVDAAMRLRDMGVGEISLADTIGTAAPEMISALFEACLRACPEVPVGAHFHATPGNIGPKVDAALDAGCRLFDSAMGGVGGCPFAKDDMTGNINTLELIGHLAARGYSCGLSPDALRSCEERARHIAQVYGAR